MPIFVIEKGMSNETETSVDVFIKILLTKEDDKYSIAQLTAFKDKVKADITIGEIALFDNGKGLTGTTIVITGQITDHIHYNGYMRWGVAPWEEGRYAKLIEKFGLEL